MLPAIHVEDLSKRYRIGYDRTKVRAHNLRGTITEILSAPLLHLRQGAALGRTEDFWALKDINFEVRPGEVVGVIGQNGAGKSTLLRILTNVTKPTAGEARIRGRVGSLLEVGTGFHPELTGRENVFLNGAILGMSRSEIRHKFDEIAAFSGVEQFLDTPVKRYSSGMRVRLAFAVAAHLDPEILLIDEVLAVGDVEFQKKCLGKMQDVSSQGRTVMFVSHNMAAVQNLCSRAIVLRRGEVAEDAPVDTAIEEYLGHLTRNTKDAFGDNPDRKLRGPFRLTGARVLDEWDQPATHLVAGRPIAIEFDYYNPAGAQRPGLCYTIFNHLGVAVTHCGTMYTGFAIEDLGERGTLRCQFPEIPLPLGQYRVSVALHGDGKEVDLVPNAAVFDVVSSVFYSSSRVPPIQYCACMLPYEWRHQRGAGKAKVVQE